MPAGLLYEQLAFVDTGSTADARSAAHFVVESLRLGKRSRENFAQLREGARTPRFEGK